MALNKEIWLSTIQENFFPDNSFMVKSIDDSQFVNNKTVHVPNAGAPSGVVINRADSAKGANSGMARRTDNDLTYSIDELTTNPVYLPEIEMVELSYDKRQSLLANDRQQLQDTAAQNLLYNWYVKANAIETTGSARACHTSSTATGTRKAITKLDVLAIATEFNKMNVPAEGRYLLLDAVMYADLLDALTGTELSAFLASANAQAGTVGRLFGIDILTRSQVLKCKANKDLLKYTDTAIAAECAVGLAWQKTCVSRALGELKMFACTDDPNWYGDMYSFLLREGGSPRRYDKLGIIPLVEVATA
jgi:hypothetical protein